MWFQLMWATVNQGVLLYQKITLLQLRAVSQVDMRLQESSHTLTLSMSTLVKIWSLLRWVQQPFVMSVFIIDSKYLIGPSSLIMCLSIALHHIHHTPGGHGRRTSTFHYPQSSPDPPPQKSSFPHTKIKFIQYTWSFLSIGVRDQKNCLIGKIWIMKWFSPIGIHVTVL